MNELELTAKNLRIHWKIVIECNAGELEIYKDVSIWLESRKLTPTSCRIWTQRFEKPVLDFQVGYFQNEDDKKYTLISIDKAKDKGLISITNNCIYMKNCFIKVIDQGLNLQVEKIMGSKPKDILQTTSKKKRKKTINDHLKKDTIVTIDLDAMEGELEKQNLPEKIKNFFLKIVDIYSGIEHIQLGSLNSQYVAGIDLRVEATCILMNENGPNPILWYQMDSAQEGLSPKFFYLELKNSSLGQSIIWNIEGDHHLEEYSTREILISGKRTILVDLDTDPEPEELPTSRFEFFVDALPAIPTKMIPRITGGKLTDVKQNQSRNNYEFSSEKVEFYIGYNPVTNDVLNGTIEKIVFDPNSSCAGCDP